MGELVLEGEGGSGRVDIQEEYRKELRTKGSRLRKEGEERCILKLRICS